MLAVNLYKLGETSSSRQFSLRYWWVNHKQTFEHEFHGNYLWSPKVNANGAYNRYYENMIRAEAGDIVFSFADAQVQGIGVVTAQAILEPKPAEFGLAGANWNEQGWMLPVVFTRFHQNRRIRPKAHIASLAPVLPKKYSPILQSGSGSQGAYLAELPYEMVEVLIRLIGDEWSIANHRLQQLVNPTIDYADISELDLARAVDARRDISETTRKQLINARVGQGLYRKRVAEIEKFCRLTGVHQLEHLRASHIKPWRKSNDSEKLAGSNGLLLSPHVDHLFDKGYIGFKSDGKLLVSSKLDYDVLNKWSLTEDRNVGSFSLEQREFLQFHEEFVFKPS